MENESLILALVTLNLVLTAATLVSAIKTNSELIHLRRPFNSLAADFKSCRKFDYGRKRI